MIMLVPQLIFYMELQKSGVTENGFGPLMKKSNKHMSAFTCITIRPSVTTWGHRGGYCVVLYLPTDNLTRKHVFSTTCALRSASCQ